jgi:hypothetical protein
MQILPIKNNMVVLSSQLQEYLVFNTTEFSLEEISIYDP